MTAGRERRLRDDLPDMLFFLTHPKTVSVGLRDRHQAQPKDLLVPIERLEQEGIAFVRSVRGGGITYHWPGQIVCYPIVALCRNERDIPEYMNKLEQIGIETLESFGVKAHRRRDSAAHLGLWSDGKKVVSMGVRVTNWVTSFGFAINLEGDISPSAYVRPCGIEGAQLTTLQEAIGNAPPREKVIDRVAECFASVFQREPSRTPPGVLEAIRSAAEPIQNMRDG
ncbi:MAG: lipoyl(octanoyl) transferase LipB [Desulfomonile tiedjei]|uniref:Octanoyltransferase n=1 Tax=Desulfomonile tiedjei TaxID=2358 RepID=A0A9D6V7W5_9BACT|nr:lipoyl(octanoyl) transferase LipB [Desulfomonile tiedjei]